MELADLYWLAGLLEGEGSFMKGPPSKPNCPYIALQMTDEDVVARAATLFRVSYRKTRNRKPGLWKETYMVQFRGQRAAGLMKDLHPLMGLRRKGQIERALASHSPKVRRVHDFDDQALVKARKTMSLRAMAKHFGASHETLRRRLTTLAMIH